MPGVRIAFHGDAIDRRAVGMVVLAVMAAFSLVPAAARADYLVVQRPVSLKDGPSTTQRDTLQIHRRTENIY